MKPLNMQEEIKANALRKAKARQGGGWKEPVVKVHKVTKEDMLAAKASGKGGGGGVQTPASVAPMMPAANLQELNQIKLTMEKMSKEIQLQKTDIATLRSENKKLQEMVSAASAAAASAEKTAAAAMEAAASATTATQTVAATVAASPTAASTADVPASPKKKKPPALLDPHSPQELVEGQRKDRELREFMKTKQGLYDAKYMSIRELPEGNLVLFKKKIYMPKKLREATIRHYKRSNETDNIALAVMRKNCCWPDLEKDFFANPHQ